MTPLPESEIFNLDRLFKQFYLSWLAYASFLIVNETSETTLAAYPQRDIQQYLAEAKIHGHRIVHAILTHFHADFIVGHLDLRDKVGAKIHLGDGTHAEYNFVSQTGV